MGVRKLVMCSPDRGFVAAIFGREHFAKVALCSLETFSWSHSKHDRWRWYDDLVFFRGRLYAVTAGEDLLGFDVGVDGRVVPGPGCRHGGTTRHGTAAPPCPGVPCPAVPGLAVLGPCRARAARLATYIVD